MTAHAAKMRDVFDRREPRATSPMLDFDERDCSASPSAGPGRHRSAVAHLVARAG
jgi:hypothetical protein